MSREILFVDDEPLVLSWHRLTMRAMKPDWEMTFVENRTAALRLIEETSFDVIVSGLNEKSSGQTDLLEEVYRRYPKTIRFLLSRNRDHQQAIESAKAAHQVLCKPCDPKGLQGAIGRMLQMEYWVRDPSVALLLSRMTVLPTLPSLCTEVSRALESGNFSMEQIGEIIARDVGMTTKILQLVNSAFFGLKRRVTSAVDAAVFIGAETLRSLLLAVHVFNNFPQERFKNFSLERFSNQSFTVGMMARRVAQIEKASSKIQEDAFLAGMLLDLGRLIVAANQFSLYEKSQELSRQKKISFAEAEREVMGATHAEIGAYLLGLWGLPSEIVDAVAFHHQPGASKTDAFNALTAVHVASYFAARNQPDALPGEAELDFSYLDKLKLRNRLEDWKMAI